VTALVGVEGGDAHQAVDAGFGFEMSIGVGSLDFDRDAFNAGFVAVLKIKDVRFITLALDPAQIHAHQHLRPVLRLGAAGAGVDGEDGALVVAGPAEHLAEFEVGDAFFQRIALGFQILEHAFIRLALGEFIQVAKIGCFPGQILPGLDPVAPFGDVAHDLLCSLIVVPETGLGYLFLERSLFVFLGLNVKGTSAERQCAPRDP